MTARLTLVGIALAAMCGCGRAPAGASADTPVAAPPGDASIIRPEPRVDPCEQQRALAESGIPLPAGFPGDVVPMRDYRLHSADTSGSSRVYRLTTTGRPASAVFDEAYARMPRDGWTLSTAMRGAADSPSTLAVEKPPRAVLLTFTDEGCGVVAVGLRVREISS